MRDDLTARVHRHQQKLDTLASYHRDPVAAESNSIIQLLELEIQALELALKLSKECDQCRPGPR